MHDMCGDNSQLAVKMGRQVQVHTVHVTTMVIHLSSSDVRTYDIHLVLINQSEKWCGSLDTFLAMSPIISIFADTQIIAVLVYAICAIPAHIFLAVVFS